MVKSIVDGAASGSDALTLCQVLVHAACPVALFVGDLALLETYVSMLIDNAAGGLAFWHGWGRCFRGVLLVRRGDVERGLAELDVALRELRQIQYGVYYIVFRSEFAAALGLAGKPAEGLAAIDEALAKSEQNDERWYLAEILRIKGDLILAGGAPAEAETCYQQSLDWARRQQTIGWELRTATSLARLWRDQGRGSEALALLAPIRNRFVDGPETGDLVAAGDGAAAGVGRKPSMSSNKRGDVRTTRRACRGRWGCAPRRR
jgi:predicted ATPase